MIDWLDRVPPWAWVVVLAITLSTVSIERRLQTLIELVTELRNHFLPFEDD
jgi:hypothetical protein